MNEQQITQLFRDEWSTLEVGPAPVEAVVTASGQRRRRVVTSVTLGLAAVLALAVVLAVSLGQPEPDPVDPVDPSVRAEPNPLDVAWVEGDELHLESVVVDVPASDGISEVLSLAQVPDGDSYGVVYSLYDGPVVHVSPDGSSTTLSEQELGAQVVSSGTAWVAWVDLELGSPELVVWDTENGEEVTRQPLPSDDTPAAPFFDRTHVVAVDGESVYVRFSNGNLLVWEPQAGPPSAVDLAAGDYLLDIAGGVTLTANRDGDEIRLVADGRPDVTTGGGWDAELSADGEYVAPGSGLGVGIAGGPKVLRTSDLQPVELDVEPGDVVLEQALGEDTATFVMGRDFVIPEDIEQDRGGYRQVLLVTCVLADGSCEVAVDDLDAEPSSQSPVLFGR